MAGQVEDLSEELSEEKFNVKATYLARGEYPFPGKPCHNVPRVKESVASVGCLNTLTRRWCNGRAVITGSI